MPPALRLWVAEGAITTFIGLQPNSYGAGVRATPHLILGERERESVCADGGHCLPPPVTFLRPPLASASVPVHYHRPVGIVLGVASVLCYDGVQLGSYPVGR